MLRLTTARHTILLTTLLALSCAPRPSPPAWEVGLDATGPIRYGSTPQEAANALGTASRDSFPAEGCDYWLPPGAPPGLRFMIENGRVVRVDVDSPGVSTAQGLHVGSTVADVRAAFGTRLVAEPHKYQWEAGWQYLSLFSPDSSRGLLFEVDSHVVRSFRAGLWPPVGYVEHCS